MVMMVTMMMVMMEGVLKTNDPIKKENTDDMNKTTNIFCHWNTPGCCPH